MTDIWKTFKRFLKVNKEGALIGGSVGLALFIYVKAKGIDLMQATIQKGLVDAFMSRSSPAAIADVKVALTAVVLGALIGIIIDALFKPGK